MSHIMVNETSVDFDKDKLQYANETLVIILNVETGECSKTI